MPTNPLSFTQKQLRFTFTLNTSAKFSDGSNTLQITGLRCTCDVTYPGPPSLPSATMRIYGMAASDMNALTGLTFQVLSYNNNSVLVETNETGAANGWATVFAGQLVTVVPDYTAEPDVALQIFAQTLGYNLLAPDTPTSYNAAPTVLSVIQQIAAKMGMTVQNDGVSGSYPGPVYFPNTPAMQLKAACKKAGIAYYLDQPGVVEIAPLGQPRVSPEIILTPQSGLIRTPTLDSVNLIGVVALYNNALRYGGQIKIQGSIQVAANGTWMIYDIAHKLSALMPDGPWFSQFTAQPPQGFVNIPG